MFTKKRKITVFVHLYVQVWNRAISNRIRKGLLCLWHFNGKMAPIPDDKQLSVAVGSYFRGGEIIFISGHCGRSLQ